MIRFFPCVGIFVFLFFIFISDSPDFRHGIVPNSDKCSIGQLKNISSDVDFLAIGSSRVLMGILPEVIEKSSRGKIKNAVNLGRQGISAARNFSIISELIERGIRPKYVYVEINLNELRLNNRDFLIRDAGFLRNRDIYSLFDLYPEAGYFWRYYFVAKHFVLKQKASIVYFVTGRWFKNSVEDGYVSPNVCWRDKFDRQDEKKRKALVSRRNESEIVNGDLSLAEDDSFEYDEASYGFKREMFFIRKIKKLCEDNAIKVFFGRHTEAFQPPMSPRSQLVIKSIVSDFVQPPADIVRLTWTGFNDPRHLAKEGRVIYSAWLGELIANESAR